LYNVILSVEVIKESSGMIIKCLTVLLSSARWEYVAFIGVTVPSWRAH